MTSQSPAPAAAVSQPFARTTASVLLDALRGVAALLVLLEHWRNAFFVDYANLHAPGLPTQLLYLLCSAGHQAVVIFFLLSGYLIGGSVFNAVHRGQWNWTAYALQRLSRLWTVLLPALLLGALWDRLGLALAHAPALYAGANYNHMTPNVAAASSPAAFFGNLAFLQTVLVPPFGSNGALWSLANEFWYYVLFPLAVCALAARVYPTPWRRLLCAVLFFAAAAALPREILLLFPVWLLGALLHRLPRFSAPFALRALSAVAYAAIFFAFAALDRKGWTLRGPFSDLLLGCLTFLFLAVLLGASSPARPSLPMRLSRASAAFSFSLYVCHTPLLVLLVSLAAGDSRYRLSPSSLPLASAALLAVLAYAYAFAALTEFHTASVRRWAERLVYTARRYAFPTYLERLSTGSETSIKSHRNPS